MGAVLSVSAFIGVFSGIGSKLCLVHLLRHPIKVPPLLKV